MTCLFRIDRGKLLCVPDVGRVNIFGRPFFCQITAVETLAAAVWIFGIGSFSRKKFVSAAAKNDLEAVTVFEFE